MATMQECKTEKETMSTWTSCINTWQLSGFVLCPFPSKSYFLTTRPGYRRPSSPLPAPSAPPRNLRCARLPSPWRSSARKTPEARHFSKRHLPPSALPRSSHQCHIHTDRSQLQRQSGHRRWKRYHDYNLDADLPHAGDRDESAEETAGGN